MSAEPGPGTAADPPAEAQNGGVADAFKAMLSFFTIFRLNVGGKEVDAMERHFGLAPCIGFLIGLFAFLGGLVCTYAGVSWVLSAAVVLVIPLLLSKFLHFDGLTDFGDGMVVSSGRQEDHIRALKDTLIGAGGFGVALVVTLLSLGAYASLPAAVTSAAFAVWPAEILTKNAMVIAAACGQPGHGMAARQVGQTGGRAAAISLVISAVLLAVVFAVCWLLSSHLSWCAVALSAGEAAALYFAALLVSVLTGWLMARTANRTFGFVNGDILGATNEIARAAMLLVCAVLAGLMLGAVF